MDLISLEVLTTPAVIRLRRPETEIWGFFQGS